MTMKPHLLNTKLTLTPTLTLFLNHGSVSELTAFQNGRL